jgi:hypothetical protein
MLRGFMRMDFAAAGRTFPRPKRHSAFIPTRNPSVLV